MNPPLLTDNPIFDGHNDLPYVLRHCLNNAVNDYDIHNNQKENPSPWIENCRKGIKKVDTRKLKEFQIFWSFRSKKFRNLKTTFLNFSIDWPRLQLGKVGANFWSVYTPCTTQYRDSVRETIEQIDVVKRLHLKYSQLMTLCTDSICVKQAWSEGKVAGMIGMEGGHSIDSSLAMIRSYYKLGARYMTLTHFCNTPWADFSHNELENNGLFEPSKGDDYIGGLTQFGRRVVREMQRVGMLVDVSHVSLEVMMDVFEEARAPVMYSHSNARTGWAVNLFSILSFFEIFSLFSSFWSFFEFSNFS